MKLIFWIVFLFPLCGIAQTDSIQVYFMGNKRGEKIIGYYNKKILFNFKSGATYKYSFKIPRDTALKENNSVIRSIHIYKRNFLKYRLCGISCIYERKKYLIIRRNLRLRKRFAFDYYWSDSEPLPPPRAH